MKKKTLLMTLLVLAIVTALSAGTLAVYTSTVDVTTDDITAKTFFINAKKNEVKQFVAKMAPGEKISYAFDVSNAEGGAVSEVPLIVSTVLDVKDDFYKVFPGAEITMRQNTNAETRVYSATSKPDALVTKMPLQAQAQTQSWILDIYWPADGDNAAHTAQQGQISVSPIKISVTGTQDVAAQ
ncbi:MAG: hypothetical protein RR085_07160 [Clostridia bacterium]